MKEEDLLVQKAQKGDSSAFGKLYDLYMPRIYRFVFLKVGNKHDAEDLTQHVFTNAWQHVEGYEFQGFPFSSWLYRIASNAVIDHYRTARPSQDLETIPEELLAQPARFEEKLDRAFDLQIVRTALKKLDSDQQSVVIMRFVEDLSTKEIATALEKSEGAVRVIQHRALKLLQTQLSKTYGRNVETTIKEA
jgi:RNA polymerase sigma-70 factor, ECF subfamily